VQQGNGGIMFHDDGLGVSQEIEYDGV